MKNVYLVGFMGTGKTSVGKELAKARKCHFVDLDDLIELKERRRITDIFAKDGEPYFRKIEKEALKEVSREKGFIVACGGGVVLDKDNIKVMKETGKLICLSASCQAILKRVGGQSHRPLLNVPNPVKQIDVLMKMRAPYYAQVDKVIDTSKLSIKQVISKIDKVTQESKKAKEKSKNHKVKVKSKK